MKSVQHLAETDIPSFRHIERHASANTIFENISKIKELAKSVGIEIMIKDNIDPNTIMQKAVLNKISTNVSKINYLIKGARDYTKLIKPAQPDTVAAAATSPGKVKMAAEDKQKIKNEVNDTYQQGIGKLKSESTTPTMPKASNLGPGDTLKVKNAQKTKHTNTMKGHASKAMKDPNHLKIVVDSLNGKASKKQIAAIIGKIKSHMVEPVEKSNDDIEKGDIGRAAKNLVIAGAMGLGVHHMGEKDSKSEAVKQIKPKQQVERTIASKPKKQGEYTDKEIAEIKKKSAEARKWLRENTKIRLKKALTAGYGGAGAPTNLTGGGVFQTEEVANNGKNKTKKSDDGEFQYISCDNCGNEQVYMGYQVKCRKCRQNFNLDKLKDLI